MYIELFGSSDRLGGNIVDMISQIIYAVNNKCYIKYNRNGLRVYNSYYQRYNSSIFMTILFDIIDDHNDGLPHENFTEYVELAAPSHFEVLSKTTLNIQQDLVSYFRNNLYLNNFRDIFMEKAKGLGYEIPFDSKKTILIHHRLEDVRDRLDYDGTECTDYMRDRIENGEVIGNEVLNITSPPPNCQMQAPLSTDKLQHMISKVLKTHPKHDVIIVTNPNENLTDLPYKTISSDDEFYDLFLLCNSETVILSRSNYALSSLFFGIIKDGYIPLWGHLPCYGLYTKYDNNNFNYFK